MTSVGRLVRLGVVSLVVALGVSIVPAGGAAAADPLGLTLDGGAGEGLGRGVDRIAVWVCKVPGTQNPKTFTPGEVAAWANAEIAPYWNLISRGRYRTVFEAEESFTRTVVSSSAALDCLDQAIDRTSAPFTNTFVIDDTDAGTGLGGSGLWSPQADGTVVAATLGDAPSDSRRGFWVGGGVYDRPATPAHEIGHTLSWPHSGSAVDFFGNYDNPADLMSGGGVDNLCPAGGGVLRGPCEITHTIAFNRYTSGWIDPADIALVTKPVTVDLAGPESAGRQMALVPSADPLVFSIVEARPEVGYGLDDGIEGIVLHTVDQTHPCGSPVCWGTQRRQKPAIGAAGSTDHVLAVGQEATLHGVTVRVDAATATGYRVSFTGAPQGCAMGPNRFVDVVPSSFAYADVGCIRLLGITTGTSPTTYAPAEVVTREQMASFLARLHRGLGGTCPTGATPFGDIGGSFATADIACIHGLEVTTGTSPTTYAPKDPVTREQMAAFLGRLWRTTPGNTCSTGGTPFGDIGGSFAAADIACIHDLGITTGTSPTTFAPQAPVTREQMASFLARYWRIA